MSTFTELRNIWRAITNLRRKVDCVCSRPNLPDLPTANGSYVLTVTDGVYTWEAA